MKCIIYSKKPEEVVRLKLTKTETCVKLIAVDADGVKIPNGSILSICDKGIHLYPLISDKLGIKTDTAGCIKIIRAPIK